MSNERRSNGILAFIVGGLVVAVGIIAYVIVVGDVDMFDGGGSTTINVETKTVEPANSGGSSGSGGDTTTSQGSGSEQTDSSGG